MTKYSASAFVTLVLAWLLFASTDGEAEQKEPLSEWGKELFSLYCVACHGFSGKGEGPVAPALKTRPTDLTLLSKNHDGQFPRSSVIQFITGDTAVAAHGTREMPVWGAIFRQQGGTYAERAKIQALTDYIESIQKR
jgi:mono/diheme cytochrome c family protein